MEPTQSQTPQVQQPINPGYLFKEKIAELSRSLQENNPRMGGLLKEIWGAIKKQPENVTIMTEEETNQVFQGLEKQMGIYMASAVVAKKTTGSKKVTAESLDL